MEVVEVVSTAKYLVELVVVAKLIAIIEALAIATAFGVDFFELEVEANTEKLS